MLGTEGRGEVTGEKAQAHLISGVMIAVASNYLVGNSPPQLPSNVRRSVTSLVQDPICTIADKHSLLMHDLA